MSYSHRFIILGCLLYSLNAHALGVFADALYWRVTETVDWVLINDASIPNQNITYKTIDFDYDLGFRVGIDNENVWYNKLYYTSFYTNASAVANGNLISTFLGGKLTTTDFFQTGQINFAINFNIIDWDFGKSFYLNYGIMVRPLLGLRGGWINQKIINNLQGTISLTETLKNNFSGIGPKVGVVNEVVFYANRNYDLSLLADFSTSYLWGNWDISDVLTNNVPETITIAVGSRNFGAFTTQALIGLGLNYKHFSMKLGYEIYDWFDQYQVLDDGTGAHENDLILQGLTLCLSYRF